MADRILTADIIAKEAVMILENELVMGNLVYRGYEEDFDNKVNGYDVGETVSIRRPPQFNVREGAVMDLQPTEEGKFSMTVDLMRGIDFAFTSQDLTLKISQLSERVIRPAMVELAQYVDNDLHSLYADVANWIGTPGQVINSFSDFSKAPQRMDEGAVPSSGRSGVMSPADYWAMLGSTTGLYITDKAKSAFENASLGMIGDVDTFKTQNAAMHTNGTWAGTPAVDGAVTTSSVSWSTVKDSDQQTITVDGFTAAAPAPAVGDVFTIADVYDVNPRKKTASLGRLKQLVVKSIANASGNQVDITFSPALIWSGAYQNCAVTTGVTDLDGKGVTVLGSDATSYQQSLFFNKSAFALAMVPLVDPPGASEVARQTYKGVSVRIIPVYDGVNDKSKWRCDILYGKKTVDQRLAVRASGTG